MESCPVNFDSNPVWPYRSSESISRMTAQVVLNAGRAAKEAKAARRRLDQILSSALLQVADDMDLGDTIAFAPNTGTADVHTTDNQSLPIINRARS